MDAGEDLDQRRFPGAVVADERDDFAGMDVEFDVGQRRDRAEMLRDAAQAQHRLGSGAARCGGSVIVGSRSIRSVRDVGVEAARPRTRPDGVVSPPRFRA